MISVGCGYKSVPNFRFKIPGSHAHNISFKDPRRQKRIESLPPPKAQDLETNELVSGEWGKRAGDFLVFVFQHLLNFHFIVFPQNTSWKKSSLCFLLHWPLWLRSVLTRQPFFSTLFMRHHEKDGTLVFFILTSHGHLSRSTHSRPRRQRGQQRPPVHSGTCSWMGYAQNSAH